MKDIKKQLPKGWRWGRLKNEITNDVSLFRKDIFAEGIFKYIDISSIDNVTKRIIGYQELSVNDAPSRAKYILQENDIIIATVRPNLNAVAIVDQQYASCVGSSGFCVVRLRSGHYPPYFFRYLTSPYFVDVVSAMVQGAMYPAINNNDVLNFEIPLPPTINDQIAIANELERKTAEVEAMRQAALRQKEAGDALQDATLGELFPYQKEEKLQEGWKWIELDILFTVEKNQIDTTNPLFFTLPFIGMENIESNTRKFVPTLNSNGIGESSCFVFDESHILYGKLRPYLNKVYLPHKPGRCAMELLPLKPKDGFTREFVASILQTKIVIEHAVKHSTGGRMPRANINKLRKLKISIPSDHDARVLIADKIKIKMDGIEKTELAIEKQLEAIEALQGAILREVFNFGKN